MMKEEISKIILTSLARIFHHLEKQVLQMAKEDLSHLQAEEPAEIDRFLDSLENDLGEDEDPGT